VEH
ncbi:hypothetical protein N499_0462, partial [Wolbachia pipientis wVitA]|jgi:hypothetical protein